jgi:FAD/FMN-containing dehydrogenase
MTKVPEHLQELSDSVREASASNETMAIRGLGTRLILEDEKNSTQAHRHVSAPNGLLDFQPDEMIVRCGAGTPLADLRSVLRNAGQDVNIGGNGTIGGALARGWSDVHRLGRGPVRDVLLETLMVGHRGDVIRVGGPTVKNVTGFDLARVLVGSLGTLGVLGEVTVRTRPIPLASRWSVVDDVDRARLDHIRRHLYRPTSLLWNGTRCWIHLEGHPLDIDEQMDAWSARPSDPPALAPYRWSARPDEALGMIGEEGDVVEVGVGLVHRRRPAPRRTVAAPEVHRRLEDEFDPRRLLNPHIRRFSER